MSVQAEFRLQPEQLRRRGAPARLDGAPAVRRQFKARLLCVEYAGPCWSRTAGFPAWSRTGSR